MKKYFLSIVALAGMLFATSCQESLVEPQMDGTTTFTVQVPDGMGTKAIGDASIIDRLYVAVYPNFDETLTVPQDLTAIYKTQADVSGGTATVTLNLIQDQKYDIVFWAQKGESYVDADDDLLSISMDKKFHNNEAGAAFFHFEPNFDPTKIRTKGIELRRPFAQLNLGTTPASLKTDVQSDSLKLFKSYIKVGNIATSFNTVKGYGEGSQEVEFSLASVPASETHEKLYVAGEKYYYVSMDYLPIAGDNEALVTVNAKITLNNESGPVVSHDFTNVPVRENYRTNIVGNLISSTTDFVVEVNDDWAGTYDRKIVEVSNATELQAAINKSEVGEVVLTQDIELTNILVFQVPTSQSGIARLSAQGRNIVFDGNGYTLKYKGADRAIEVSKEQEGLNLTLKNLNIELASTYAQRGVNYNTNGKLVLDNVKIKPNSNSAFTYAINLPGSSDGANVEIINSEICGNIALNVWGENVSVNVVNTDLYNFDKTDVEDYSTIVLNNDGTTSAEYSVINIDGGKIVSKNQEGIASVAIRNNTIEGEIICSDDTFILGSTEISKAVIKFKGSSDFYSFYSLEDAIEKVDDYSGVEEIVVLRDLEISKIDLTSCTKDVVINCNDKTITTSSNYGVEVDSDVDVVLKNGEIVMTKEGDYITYAAGFKINNGDYTGKTIKLDKCTITMANTDWAYAVNMPASVNNLNLVVNQCKLTGAIALQCWGDNNNITISNSELICNYKTSALYTSGCVALQKNDGGYAAEYNNLLVTGSSFTYSGTDNFDSTIFSVVDYNGVATTNTIQMSDCTYGEKVCNGVTYSN
ncbi:MAG: hypothetical protein J6U51_03870 [Bacteroidales bacterium]|nr:hypothetical protein [Bacteroidales bacterium]